ncbi:MAG: hypothetical protein GY765_19710 [bacterium]|nr:hypothetical protein [bacterium]
MKNKFTAIVSIIVAIICCLGFNACSQGGRTGWGSHYISANGTIIRYSCKKTELIKDNTTTVVEGCAIPLREGNDFIYMQIRGLDDGKCMLRKLVKYHLPTHKQHPLIEIAENFYLSHGSIGKNGFLKNNTYYNILRNTTDNQYKVIIAEPGKTAKQIPIYGYFNNEPIDELFHITHSPRQFLVATKGFYFRVPESGDAVELPIKGIILGGWKNRVFVFQKRRLLLYDINEKVEVVFQQDGGFRQIKRKYADVNLSKVLCRKGRQYYLTDMEQGTWRPVNIESIPYYYEVAQDGESLHLLWVRGKRITYGRLENDTAVEIKNWETKITTDQGRAIAVFNRRVLVYGNDTYEQFAFPGEAE